MLSTLAGHLVRTFHRIVFVAYIFSIFYENKYVVAPKGSKEETQRKAFGGRFKYLTYLNATLLQAVFFGLTTINDAVKRERGKPSRLQRFLDFFFTSMVFPVGCFVSVSFWGLFLTDRELVMPASFDSWYPQWLCHLFHTMPIVTLLIEVLVVEHKYQKGFFLRWMPMVLLFAAYVSWIFYVAQVGKFWIYPVFGVLEPLQRFGFLALMLTPFFILFFVGEKLNNLVWGKGNKRSSAQSKDSGKKQKEKGSPKKKGKSSAPNSPKKSAPSSAQNSPKKKAQTPAANSPKKAAQSPGKSPQKKSAQSPKSKSKRE